MINDELYDDGQEGRSFLVFWICLSSFTHQACLCCTVSCRANVAFVELEPVPKRRAITHQINSTKSPVPATSSTRLMAMKSNESKTFKGCPLAPQWIDESLSVCNHAQAPLIVTRRDPSPSMPLPTPSSSSSPSSGPSPPSYPSPPPPQPSTSPSPRSRRQRTATRFDAPAQFAPAPPPRLSTQFHSVGGRRTLGHRIVSTAGGSGDARARCGQPRRGRLREPERETELPLGRVVGGRQSARQAGTRKDADVGCRCLYHCCWDCRCRCRCQVTGEEAC